MVSIYGGRLRRAVGELAAYHGGQSLGRSLNRSCCDLSNCADDVFLYADAVYETDKAATASARGIVGNTMVAGETRPTRELRRLSDSSWWLGE